MYNIHTTKNNYNTGINNQFLSSHTSNANKQILLVYIMIYLNNNIDLAKLVRSASPTLYNIHAATLRRESSWVDVFLCYVKNPASR